jgi:hypothetical protein
MQSGDTGSHSAKRIIVSPKQHRHATYSKVLDKRKRPIRGLWERSRERQTQKAEPWPPAADTAMQL